MNSTGKEVMTMRYGRLNEVDVQSQQVVKTCVVKEETRPQKLFIEKWALEQARTEGIQTPQIISYRRDERDNEVLVMERVAGIALSHKITDESVQAFTQVGKQLAKRRTDHHGYGWIDPRTMMGIYSTWKEFLLDYAMAYCPQLIKCSIILPDEQTKLLDRIAGCLELDNAPSSLVHRDVKPSNIIWGENGAFLIDWENVMLGDPYYDLCVYQYRFGTGRRWDSLMAETQTVDPTVECIYSSIALIGGIDFCVTYKYGIREKSKQLRELIALL